MMKTLNKTFGNSLKFQTAGKFFMRNISLGILFCLSTISIHAQVANFEGVADGTVTFADIDNDNDQDVLITGRNASDQAIAKLYRNDGNANFTEDIEVPFAGIYSNAVAFADIDNDNDLDLLITGTYGYPNGPAIAKLYANDGFGNFLEISGTPFEAVSSGSIAFADIDNDYDMDVLLTGAIGNFLTTTKLYTNDGNGNFTELMISPFQEPGGGLVTFADVDDDGDQDLLITGAYQGFLIYNSDNVSSLYLNDGNGNFTETGTPFVPVGWGSATYSDINNDSDQDLIISGGSCLFCGFSSAQYSYLTKLYINDGIGNFTEDTEVPFAGDYSGVVAFSDIDIDSDQDVLIIADNDAKFYINDGDGNFDLVPGSPFDPNDGSLVAFADVDNDGDPDVIISGGFTTTLYINDGSGEFTEATGVATDVPENTGLDHVLISPNPSQGQITVDLQDLSNVSINIYSLSGSQLYHQENISVPQYQFELNAEAGIYILEVSTQQESQRYKLVKQ